MTRLIAAVAVSCFLLSGCEAPEPPQPEAPPPALTAERAKQALAEMIVAQPNAVPDIHADEVLVYGMEPGDENVVRFGQFRIDPSKRTWRVSVGNIRNGMIYSGDFQFEDGSWMARPKGVAEYCNKF
jgi:hypothetical protein